MCTEIRPFGILVQFNYANVVMNIYGFNDASVMLLNSLDLDFIIVRTPAQFILHHPDIQANTKKVKKHQNPLSFSSLNAIV